MRAGACVGGFLRSIEEIEEAGGGAWPKTTEGDGAARGRLTITCVGEVSSRHVDVGQDGKKIESFPAQLQSEARRKASG